MLLRRRRYSLGVAIKGLLICIVFFIFLDLFATKVDIPDTIATLSYKYNGTEKTVKLSEAESKTIKNIFNGSKTYSDSPSCGFSDEFAISFDDKVFCIARDMCPIIQYNGKYFNITSSDSLAIIAIFKKYDASFPFI